MLYWKATLAVLLGVLGAMSARAGTDVASDAEIAKLRGRPQPAALPGTTTRSEPEGKVQIAVTRPEGSYVFPEPNILQAIAASLTKTTVLLLTRDERLARKDGKDIDIIVRRRRLTARYTRDAYGEKCYLAIGAFIKWETLNGQWTGRKVSLRALDRAFAVCAANGIGVSHISVSVTSREDLRKTKIILDELNLKKRSLIGINPYVGNRATVILAGIK